MLSLYNPPKSPGDSDILHENADPSELPKDYLPPIVEIVNGPRMVEIVYRSMSEEGHPIHRSWLALNSLPLIEVIPTIIWFLLQLGIFAVAGMTFWKRPFDRSTLIFFLLCMCGMGAFAGGFHWWMVGGSLWLNLPFICTALLLPMVIFHFFLIYPRPKQLILRSRRIVLSALYSIPLLAWITLGTLFWYLQTQNSQLDLDNPSREQILHLRQILEYLVHGIWIYLIISGLFYLGAIGTLAFSLKQAGDRMERMQLATMLAAGALATIPIVYSIYLAHYDRVGFVMGSARIPMFLASLVFQLAFVVGIVRYNLMLAGKDVPRGSIYYISSIGTTSCFALMIAFSIILALRVKISLSSFQHVSMIALLVIVVLLLVWLRDRIQRAIDQKFYREKYQLDKAMQRMNRAVSQFADLNSLTEMVFGICRDALQIDKVALYERHGDSRPVFSLIAAEAVFSVPDRFETTAGFLKELREAGILQRVPAGSREKMGETQQLLHRFEAQIIQILEMDHGVYGLLVLGEKRNGAAYSAEDFAFLQALGQITIVALHNLRAQEEMVHLNEEVRLKMDRITEQGRQISLLQAELNGIDSGRLLPAPPAQNRATELERGKLKGNSEAIGQILTMVSKISHSESSVLIRGESGTGKELLAEILHENSPRREHPLVIVHCAALSSNLLESELFGHVKGAFTGAHTDKIGRFQAAAGGTIFLDEIGDISLDTQVKLLRVLQTRSFEPVGSTEPVHVDVRLITATHQNLERLIEEGKFREDLYYRLNVISLTLPALRERPEDILELAIHFLNRKARQLGKSHLRMTDEVLRRLEEYHWP
ncbi:MAG TPA: sigma 54-interacting transcriptional regulator, partial [Planctomycetaceae bacterium]|nr:sigma 54-interacting transcriptional regulator [Planctomycetaceae bacterium]